MQFPTEGGLSDEVESETEAASTGPSALSWFPPRWRYVIWGGREFSPRPLERLKHASGFQLKSQNLSSLSVHLLLGGVSLIPLTLQDHVAIRIQELGWGCVVLGPGVPLCHYHSLCTSVCLAKYLTNLTSLIVRCFRFCGQPWDCCWFETLPYIHGLQVVGAQIKTDAESSLELS